MMLCVRNSSVRVTLSANDAGPLSDAFTSVNRSWGMWKRVMIISSPLASSHREQFSCSTYYIATLLLLHYCYSVAVRAGSRRGEEPHSSDWRRRGDAEAVREDCEPDCETGKKVSSPDVESPWSSAGQSSWLLGHDGQQNFSRVN